MYGSSMQSSAERSRAGLHQVQWTSRHACRLRTHHSASTGADRWGWPESALLSMPLQ